MNRKFIFILAVLVLVLAGCSGEPVVVDPDPRPSIEESNTPVPVEIPSGVVILADGLVQTAQPALPLTFEIGGRLLSVDVQAGDQVQEGDILARLDADETIVSYKSTVTAAELSVLRAQQALDDLINNAATMTSQAQMNLAVAQDELQNAEYRWQVQQAGSRASGDTIAAAEANLVLAEREVEQAQAQFNRYSGREDDDPLRALALSNLVAAKQRRDSVLRGLNWYTGSPTELAQARLDAEVAIAQAQLETAEREWDDRKNGPDPDEVALAEGELANAQAHLTQAENDLEKAIAGDVLIAPLDGTILSVESTPGSQVGPGSPILVLLDTTQFEFHTTNLSERDMAQIIPGQSADVILKAYPNDPIEATVIRIGWQVGQIIGDAATFPVVLSLTVPILRYALG